MKQVRSEKGFTLIELIISLFVVMVILFTLIPVLSRFYDTYNNLLSQERLKTIRDKIERYYYQYAFVINSDVLDSRYNYNVVHSNGNSYPTVAIPLPDGTYLYSLLTHQNTYDDLILNVNGSDIARVSNPSGLLYFTDNPYDGKMTNFRVYITPLIAEPQGRFHYRDIYLIYTKGSRYTRSIPVNNGGNLNCDVSEVCYKIDGLKITQEIYNQTTEKMNYIANKLRQYSQSKYALDTSKNGLMYYYAITSTNNRNSSNCNQGEVDCYFSTLSEIPNTTLAGGIRENRITFNMLGLSINFNPSPALNGRFVRLSNLGNLFSNSEDITPVGSFIYLDNSASARNPQTLGQANNLGGADIVLLTCIANNDCIVYRVSQ
jgi:type II secretory pathway pseudopilin PulG